MFPSSCLESDVKGSSTADVKLRKQGIRPGLEAVLHRVFELAFI